MLDYFLFDRAIDAGGRTPVQAYADQQDGKRSAIDVQRLRAFSQTTHSLFEVRKFLKEGVRLRNLLAGGDTDVFERRKLAGLNKGDIFDARLLPFAAHCASSPPSCLH